VFHVRALYHTKTLITNKCTKRVLSSIVTHSYMFWPCWVIFRENFSLPLHYGCALQLSENVLLTVYCVVFGGVNSPRRVLSNWKLICFVSLQNKQAEDERILHFEYWKRGWEWDRRRETAGAVWVTTFIIIILLIIIIISFRSPYLFYLLTAGVEVVYFYLITLKHTP
jgi:hypothetical protein